MEFQSRELQPSYYTTSSFSYPVDVFLNCGEVAFTVKIPADKCERNREYSQDEIKDIVRDHIPNFDFYNQSFMGIMLDRCHSYSAIYYKHFFKDLIVHAGSDIITFQYFGVCIDPEKPHIMKLGQDIFCLHVFKGQENCGSFVLRNGILYHKNPGSDVVTGLKLLFAPASIFLNELYCSAPIKLKLRGLIAMFIVPIIALIGLLFSPWCTNYCNFLIADLDCWVNGFDKKILASSSCETRSSERSFVPMHLRPYLLVNTNRIFGGNRPTLFSQLKEVFTFSSKNLLNKRFIVLSKYEEVLPFALDALFSRLSVDVGAMPVNYYFYDD